LVRQQSLAKVAGVFEKKKKIFFSKISKGFSTLFLSLFFPQTNTPLYFKCDILFLTPREKRALLVRCQKTSFLKKKHSYNKKNKWKETI